MSGQEKIKLPNEVYFYSAIPAKARGRIPSASPTGRQCNDPATSTVNHLCRMPPLKRPSSPAHHYLRSQEGLDLSSQRQKFRNLSSARHKRGTPRSLWVDSPTNATMTDIMVNCSYKGQSKIIKGKQPPPDYPLLPDAYNDETNGTRLDEEWIQYLKDIERFQKMRKQHYIELEESARLNKLTIAPHILFDASMQSPDTSMDFVDRKSTNERIWGLETTDTNLLKSNVGNGCSRTEDSVVRYRPMSAPAMLKPMFPQIKEHTFAARATLSPPETASLFENEDDLVDIAQDLFEYDHEEPPRSKIFRTTTLGLRSSLTLHDRWINHLLETFEHFESMFPPWSDVHSITVLYQYKNAHRAVVKYVLDRLVQFAHQSDLKRRIVEMQRYAKKLMGNEYLILLNMREDICLYRRQRASAMKAWIDDWSEDQILSSLRRAAFCAWKYYVQYYRSFKSKRDSYINRLVPSNSKTLFQKLWKTASITKRIRHKEIENNQLYSSLCDANEKLIAERREYELVLREEANERNVLNLLAVEEETLITDIKDLEEDGTYHQEELLRRKREEECLTMMLEDQRSSALRTIYKLRLQKMRQLEKISLVQKEINMHVTASRTKVAAARGMKNKKKASIRVTMLEKKLSTLLDSINPARPLMTADDQRIHDILVHDSTLFLLDFDNGQQQELVPACLSGPVDAAINLVYTMVLKDSVELCGIKINALFDKQITRYVTAHTEDGKVQKILTCCDQHILPPFNGRILVQLKHDKMTICSQNTAVPYKLHLVDESGCTSMPIIKLAFKIRSDIQMPLAKWLQSPQLLHWIASSIGIVEKANESSGLKKVKAQLEALPRHCLKVLVALSKPPKAVLLEFVSMIQRIVGLQVSSTLSEAAKQLKSGTLRDAMIGANLLRYNAYPFEEVEKYLNCNGSKASTIEKAGSKCKELRLCLQWMVASTKWKRAVADQFEPLPTLKSVCGQDSIKRDIL